MIRMTPADLAIAPIERVDTHDQGEHCPRNNPAQRCHIHCEQGVGRLGPMLTETLKKVSFSHSFEKEAIADRGGWNANYFVCPDGSAVEPRGADRLIVSIKPAPGRCSQSGTLKGWKRKVAEPLNGHSLPMFALMLPFMPPILRLSPRHDNFGFELVGKKGVGKSTIQQLAASPMGPPMSAGGVSYGMTFDTTINALEDTMETFGDMLLVIEESNLFFAGESKAKRGAQFRAFAFKAAAGSHKNRYGITQSGEAYRFSYLTSSNERMTSLVGDDEEVTRAAEDRLISLIISDDRDFGVFDFLPTNQPSASAFADSLMKGATKHHGVAGRAYLQALVNDQANNGKTLRKRIRAFLTQFREAAKVDQNSGSAVRVADSFGLVYAAGMLARGYGILPSQFNCLGAALACYLQHVRCRSLGPSFDDRLRTLADHPAAVQLEDERARLSRAELKEALAIVIPKPGGIELLIPQDRVDEALPDWRLIRQQSAVLARLVREGSHLTVKRTLTKKGDRPRVLLFRVPEADDRED